MRSKIINYQSFMKCVFIPDLFFQSKGKEMVSCFLTKSLSYEE